jgi:hypothetical protein
MMQSRHLVIAFVLGAVATASIMFAATPPFQALNRQDLNLVNPLQLTPDGGQNDTTLQIALKAIGATNQTLMVTPGAWTIRNDVTIPANVHVWLAAGAQLAIESGKTLTINGSFDAPPLPVFSGPGNVILNTRTSSLRAEWWGVVCDDSTNNAIPIRNAIRAARDGMILEFPAGICRMGALDITGTRGLNFRGAMIAPTGATGIRGTGTKWRAAGPQPYVLRLSSVQYLRFEGISFDGNFQTSTAVVLIDSDTAMASHIVFEQCLIERTVNNTGNLLQLGNRVNSQVDYVVLRSCILDQDFSGSKQKARVGIYVKNSNSFLNWVYQTRISNATLGVEMHNGSINLHGIDFGLNTIAHVQITQGAQSFTIEDCYSEFTGPNFIKSASPVRLVNAPTIYIRRCTMNASIPSVWNLNQPLILEGNTFALSSFVVNELGGGVSKYRVLALGNKFSGTGIGFGGSGLSSVDEYETTTETEAGAAATSTTIRHANTTLNTLTLGTFTFNNLGALANGTMRYCSDCAAANPCAGGGTGAIAKRLNGRWVCN